MPEDPEFAALPAASPLKHLCNETIDIAKRIDPFVAHAVKERGYGRIIIDLKCGEVSDFDMSRRYRRKAS